MAWTEREVIIANPARKRKNKAMKRRKLSAAQIRAGFGGKRRKSASGKRRSNPKRRAVARKRATPKKSHRRRSAPRRKSNPGEIIMLGPLAGNPAKRRKKAVAKTRRRKSTSARRHTNAGHRRTKRRANPARRTHRRRNPGSFGGVTDLVALGGGAVIGGSIPSIATQAVLGSKNTGVLGYLSNLAATFLIAWGVGKVAKGKTGHTLSMGIIAGGIGSVIKRAITDYSILGSFGAQLGMGDYMVSNFVTPQRVADGLNSPMVEYPMGWGQPAQIAAPAGAAGGMGCFGPPLYG